MHMIYIEDKETLKTVLKIKIMCLNAEQWR